MTLAHTLTRKQLQELEAELLAERARLERALASETEANAATDLAAVPLRALADGGLAMSLETRTQARYAAILDALTRLAAGTYGICVSCDDRIPFGRLIVMPEVNRCVACCARG